jgi:hypothetical protein
MRTHVLRVHSDAAVVARAARVQKQDNAQKARAEKKAAAVDARAARAKAGKKN